MFKRIDITKIIRAHYKSLRSLNGNKIGFSDLFLFIIFPLLISFFLFYKNISIQSQISSLVTALSILAGFLFNLLAIIHNSLSKIKEEINAQSIAQDSLKFRFANEIHANISYNILVAIFSIIALVWFGLDIKFNDEIWDKSFFIFLNSICSFLIVHFLFNLMMILNRIYILLDKE